MLKNGHFLSFSINCNLQNMESHIHETIAQRQIILLTCVRTLNIARASSNFKMKYTKNGKI